VRNPIARMVAIMSLHFVHTGKFDNGILLIKLLHILCMLLVKTRILSTYIGIGSAICWRRVAALPVTSLALMSHHNSRRET
jgi:hypothetical protein